MINLKKLIFWLIFICLTTRVNAQEYTLTSPDIKVYIPHHAPQVRGIICFLPGLGQDTRWASDSSHFFSSIARHYDMAMLGADQFYMYTEQAVEDLLQHMDSLGKLTGHPELSYVPFAVSGGSMGGGSAYHINHFHPERVIGFFGIRTHLPSPPELNPESLKTPMLFNPGQLDDRYPGIMELVKDLNENGGMAAVMLSWGSIHSPRKNDGLFWYGFSYLSDIIEKRYPFQWPQNLNGSVELKDMDTSIAWKADNYSWNPVTQIYPCNNYPAELPPFDYSWIQDEENAHSFVAATSFKDPSLTNPYLENEVRISGTGSVVVYNQGSVHDISVWSEKLSDIDSVYLFKDNLLLKAVSGDSLSYSDTLHTSGWHRYFGFVKYGSGQMKTSAVYTVWSDGEPYNPEDLPTFKLNGKLEAYEGFSDSITAEVELFDASKICTFSLNNEDIDFVEMHYDSIEKKIVLKAIPDKYGKGNILLTAEENGSQKQYTRKIFLYILPRVQLFSILSYREYYAEFGEKTIAINVRNPEIPSEYEIFKKPDFVECSIDTTRDMLIINSIMDMDGHDSIIIRSWNPYKPEREYFDTLELKVFHNIKFSRPYSIEVNIQNPVPDTLWLSPFSENDYDVQYIAEENEFVEAEYYGEGEKPAFLLKGKKPCKREFFRLKAVESGRPENIYKASIYLNVVDEPTGNQSYYQTFDFSVYPNPANDLLTIETNQPEHLLVRITSVNGQLIQSSEMEGTTHQLDISFFQKGVYFITIWSKDFIKTEKIMKL